MTTKSPRRRTVSLAADDRARIPFAMIAVLLLVTSVVTIGALEQRSEPVIEQDADLVADRTETAAQSELRSATIDASHAAVSAPVINASASEIDAIDESQEQPVNFENYLKLLIYLEAHDRLPAAGQTVGSEAESTVSIPDVTAEGEGGDLGPDDAIGRVDLTIGDDPETDLEPGLLEVTIRDVEIDVDVDGDPVPAESKAVTTTVGTPAFQLNERTETYESTLDEGFFEEADDGLDNELDGLGQRMAARLYAFAYFKAGWDRMHKTRSPDDHDFERVLEPNHTEVLANHAIFATQEDVFGTQDPYAERTLRPGYTCMAYQIGESMSGDDDDESGDLVDEDEFDMDDDIEGTEENESIDIEEQLCDGGEVQKWLFGDQATGELPDMPELSELIEDGLGEMDVMNQEQEVPIENLAGISYQYYDVQTRGDSVDEEALFEESTDDLLNATEGEGEDRYDDAIDPGDTPTLENDERSIQRMVDELYTVDIDTEGGDASVHGTLPSAGSAPSANHSLTFDVEMADVTAIDVDHEGDLDPDDPSTEGTHDRSIHDIEARADIEIYAVETWEHDDPDDAASYGELPKEDTERHNETITVDLSLDITGTYDFEERGVYKDEFEIQEDPDLETDYRQLESSEIDPDELESIDNESVIEPADTNTTTEIGYNVNFLQAFVDAALDVTHGVDHYGSLEDDLEANVGGLDGNSVGTTGSGSDTSTNRSDIAAQFQGQVLDEHYDDRYDLKDMKADRETDAIEDDLLSELNSTDEDFREWIGEENNTYTVERAEMLDTDEEPVYGAIDHIEEVEDDFVYENLSADGPDDTFSTPGELATAQVRLAYFDRLYHYIEKISEQYREQVGELEDEIDEMGEGSIDVGDDLLGFVQDILNADVERDPEEIEGSPVLDDAHFEVSGSPTYMTHENISEDEDPAVRPENATITDFDAETEHVPLTIQSENRLPWPGLPITAVPPTYWLLQTNTWTNTIKGEYARFEVSATVGDPSDADRLTYVREHRPVEPELHDGNEVTLGVNEPITFESTTEVVVAMPGGVVSTGAVPAVADTEPRPTGQTACSPTWEYTGPDFDPATDTVVEAACDHPENATAELKR